MFRALVVLLVAASALCSSPRIALGQAALAATELDPEQLPPESRLTLRPSAGLEVLAAKVARVLTLRTGAVVDVGDTPPPGLLEAVPAGHIALARENGQVRLVLGAALGQSFEAVVQLADDQGESDVRSVALAVEALRDRAVEARADLVEHERTSEAVAVPISAVEVAAEEPSSVSNEQLHSPPRDDANEPEPAPLADKRLKPVEPLFYLRAYSGASTESAAPGVGVGAAGGLCVLGNCWVLTVEYPIAFTTPTGGSDIRYLYTTFTSGFYTHPVSFGRFTPGASIGFLTRIGHFERDMGLPDAGGLETDLGVRATAEGAFEVVHRVDLLAELGMDYALDRWRLGHGDAVAYRGERAIPWLQAGVRVRAY